MNDSSRKKNKLALIFTAFLIVACGGYLLRGFPQENARAQAEGGKVRASSTQFSVGSCSATNKISVSSLNADVSSGSAPLAVTFTANVYGFNGAFNYSWDFDGDGVVDESGALSDDVNGGSCTAYTTSHIFLNNGSYQTIFSVTDGFGYGSNASASVAIDVLSGGGNLGYSYEDIYNYPGGILVYTEAQKVEWNSSGDITSYFDYATAGGSTVQDRRLLYTLRVTNPGSAEQAVDLKFTLPSNKYRYIGMLSGDPDPDPVTSSVITWPSYMAPPGESTVSFRVEIQ